MTGQGEGHGENGTLRVLKRVYQETGAADLRIRIHLTSSAPAQIFERSL